MTAVALRFPVAAVPATREIQITADLPAASWDRFVDRHPAATLYHGSAWRGVFEQAFGQETIYLAGTCDGEVSGVLPLVIFRSRLFGRFAVSLPFVDGGGVCADDAGTAALLVEQAGALASEQRLSHVELRHVGRQFPDLPARQHKVGMTLALERDAAAAWTALDRKVRNQVRKAEKSGLVARSGGAELIDRFYPVFARNMRDLGTPVWPRTFFDRAVTACCGTARVFLVEQGDTVVAGAVAFIHRDALTVPWASSLREYRALAPNNLLYWRMIEHAIACGLRTFDFGRSTPGEGTYQFKEQWGATPTPLAWEYLLQGNAALPNLSPSNPRFRLAIDTWQRLPLPLASWLGPRISRAIP